MLKTPTALGRLALAVLVPALLTSCLGDDQTARDPELLGTASIALTGVPADGTCIVVEAHGNRTVTRELDATAGSTMVVHVSGLPVGKVTFKALAFGSSCATRGTMPANWVSDADFTTTIAVSPSALVTLNLVRNGMADISIGFNDDAPTPDGGSSGSTDGGSSGGGSGAVGDGSFFLQLDGIPGESSETGLDDAFTLENFVTAVATTTSSAGGGGGAGKSTFHAFAIMKYQKGAPQLYTTSATGKHIKTAIATAKKKKGDGTKQTYYIVTLTDVLISSVESSGSGDVPELTVGLDFSAIKIAFRGGVNPDGSQAPATVVDWDLKRITGSGAGDVPFDFLVGATPVAPVKAVTAFHAPSEQNGTSSAGGGGGAGKAVFSDASVELPVDADVLRYFANSAAGRHLQTGSVTIDTAGPTGPVTFGQFGFKDLVITGVKISGLDATVTFDSVAFSWTTFSADGAATTTMFDTKTGKV